MDTNLLQLGELFVGEVGATAVVEQTVGTHEQGVVDLVSQG